MKSRGLLARPLHVALLALLCASAGCLPISTSEDRVLLMRATALGLGAKDAAWAEGPFSCDVVVQRKCSALTAPPRVVGACGATPAAPLDMNNRTLKYYTCTAAAAAATAPAGAPSSSSSSSSGGAGAGLLREAWRGAVGRRPAAPAPGAPGARPPPRRGVWDAPPPAQDPQPPPQPQLPAAPPCADPAAAPLVCLETVPQVPPTGRAPVRVDLGKRTSSAQAGSRCTCFLRHSTQAGGTGEQGSGAALGLEASPYVDAYPMGDLDALYGHSRQAPR